MRKGVNKVVTIHKLRKLKVPIIEHWVCKEWWEKMKRGSFWLPWVRGCLARKIRYKPWKSDTLEIVYLERYFFLPTLKGSGISSKEIGKTTYKRKPMAFRGYWLALWGSIFFLTGNCPLKFRYQLLLFRKSPSLRMQTYSGRNVIWEGKNWTSAISNNMTMIKIDYLPRITLQYKVLLYCYWLEIKN